MENSGRDWVVLAGLCLAGIVLGRLQDSARDGGRADLVSSFVQSAISPAAAGLGGFADGLSDARMGLFSGGDLVKRNRRLEQQIRATALYDAHVTRLQQEVDSLRRMLELPAIEARQKTAADVIGYFPRESRITISAGSNQGVRKGAPVITGDGLLGVVSTVAATRSQVLLLSHSRLQIGAITAGDPAAAGLLRGESSSTFLMEIPDMSAPIAVGDPILTAGFSERIPKGIPIGTVYEVDNDVQFGRKLARIRPAVQVGAIREVLVLR